MIGQLFLSLVAITVGGAGLLFFYLWLKPALFIAILSGMALLVFYFCLGTEARQRLGRRPVIIAFLMPIAGWLLPNVWLLYAVMAGLVPVLARRAGEVAPLYLLSLPLLPGLDQTIHLGSLKLFEFGVHDALATGSLAALLARGSRPSGKGRFDVPFWGVLVLIVTATARDTSFTNFVRVFINAGFDFALPYYIISRSLRTPEDFRAAMLHLACAAAILSMVLIYEVRSSWPLYNTLYDHYGIHLRLLVKARGGLLRAAGPCLESTSMALVLVLCFMAAWLSRRAFASRLHHLSFMGLLFAGLLAPQSRGAWIGLMVAMVAADTVRGQVGTVMRRGALAAAAGVTLILAAQVSPRLAETLGLSGGGSAETVDYRQRLFDRGIEEFRKKPLLGDSFPAVIAKMEDLRQGEGIVDFVNSYIFVALVSGAVGLAIFTGSFLTYVSWLWQRRRRAIRQGEAEALAFVFAGVVTLMEMLFFTSFDGRVSLFVFVFLGLAAGQLRAGRQASGAAPAQIAFSRA